MESVTKASTSSPKPIATPRKAKQTNFKPPLKGTKSVDSALDSFGNPKTPKVLQHFFETVNTNSSSQSANPKLTPSPQNLIGQKDKPFKPPRYKSPLRASKSSEFLTHGTRSKLIAPSVPVSQVSQTAGGSPSHDPQKTLSTLMSTSPQRRMHKDRLDRKKHVQLNPAANPTSGLSLKDLIREHSKSFPLKVVVVKGDENCYSIRAGNVFNIHFVKNTKVVIIVDRDGNKYNLPFNTAAKVGLIYSLAPYKDKRTLNRPSVFETAGDIIYAAERPKVIIATKKIKSQDGKTELIAKDELLMPHEVKASDFGQAQHLRVYSFTNQCEKAIPYKALGKFTTDPLKCKLHLHELVERVPDLFPSKAIIFFADLNLAENPLPHAIKHEVVTMQEESTITTVVVSQCTNKDLQKSVSQVLKTVELSIELDITVALIDASSTNGHLKDNKEHPYDDILTPAQSLKSSPQDPEMLSQNLITEDYVIPHTVPWSDAQAFLLKQVRSGYEHTGMSIEEPGFISLKYDAIATTRVPRGNSGSNDKSEQLHQLLHSPDDLQLENKNAYEYQPLIFPNTNSTYSLGSGVNSNEYQLLTSKETTQCQQGREYEYIDNIQQPKSSTPSKFRSIVTQFKSNFEPLPGPPPIPSSPRPEFHTSSTPVRRKAPPPPSPDPRQQCNDELKVPLIVLPHDIADKPTISPPVQPTSSTLDSFEISPFVTTLDPPNSVQSANEESKSEMEALKARCQKLEQEVQKLQEQMKLVLKKVSI